MMALLIGASDYDAPGIAPLPFVPEDMAALGKALRQRSYDDVVIARPRKQVSANFVNLEVGRFLRRSRSGDTLLICLSGHGYHAGAQDYFLPEDAHPEIEPFHTGLVALDWRRELQAAPAGRIVILVDACRDGLRPGFHGDTMSPSLGWSRGDIDHALHQKVAWVYACSEGQKARFVRADERVRDGVDCGTRSGESFSLFSRAVRDVLLGHRGALDLRALEEDVQDRVEELHRAYGKTTIVQRVRIRGDRDDFPVAGPLADTEAEPPTEQDEDERSDGSDHGPAEDPLRKLAFAQYRFLHHDDDGPLLDLAATGSPALVVQLAELVPEEARTRIWDACAVRRPGPALFDLLRTLHGMGLENTELAVFSAALRVRPADEVFQGVPPGSVEDTFNRFATTRDSAGVVAVVEALYASGLAEKSGRLLYGTVWSRLPDELPALVAVLRRAGLLRAANAVLDQYGRHCPSDGLGAVLDALSGPGGRRGDRERLLAAAARRAAPELLACVQVLRAEERDQYLPALLGHVATAGPVAVALVLHLLARVPDTDMYVNVVLEAAVDRLTVTQLVDVVRSLRDVGHGEEDVEHDLVDDFLGHCIRRRGFVELLCLVRLLGSRWLDRDVRVVLELWLRGRPIDELPRLIEALTVSGHDEEAEHVVAGVAGLDVAAVVDVCRAIRTAGMGTEAVRLIGSLFSPGVRDDLPSVCEELCDAGAEDDIREAAERAALRLPLAELSDALVPRARLTRWHVFLRNAVAGRRPLDELTDLLGTLSTRENSDAGRQMGERVGEYRPVADLPGLVGALGEAGADDAVRTILKGASRRPVVDLILLTTRLGARGMTTEADQLFAVASRRDPIGSATALVNLLTTGEATGSARRMVELLLSENPFKVLRELVTGLRRSAPNTAADHVLCQLGGWSPPETVVEVVRGMRADGRGGDVPRDVRLFLRGVAMRGGAGKIYDTMHRLGSAELTADAGTMLSLAAELSDPRALAELIRQLDRGRMRAEAREVLETAAQARPVPEIVESLRRLFSREEMDWARKFLGAAARHRDVQELTDLLTLLWDVAPEALRQARILHGLAAHTPPTSLARIAGALNGADRFMPAVLVLRAAFDQVAPGDLAGLVRGLGMTRPDPGTAAPAPEWQAFRGFLAGQLLPALLDQESVLREAGLTAAASAVLDSAVRRSAMELAAVVNGAGTGPLGESRGRLLTAAAEGRRLPDVLEALRPLASRERLDRILGELAECLPPELLAAEALLPSAVQPWAMRICPRSDLVSAMVYKALLDQDGLDPGSLELFLRHRGVTDVVLLLESLRNSGAAFEESEDPASRRLFPRLAATLAAASQPAEAARFLHAYTGPCSTDELVHALRMAKTDERAVLMDHYAGMLSLTELCDILVKLRQGNGPGEDTTFPGLLQLARRSHPSRAELAILKKATDPVVPQTPAPTRRSRLASFFRNE
ncbi:caspase family protein [Streptomyces sp. NPDC048254]|uniref:caspase family protein n=1 Tax=Streptomyces sp. NPDC048254 TaxID=3365525 RepID=UPI003716E96A